MTKVVNIKLTDNYDIYIGRPSIYGNNHPIGFCKICNQVHTREDAVEAFRIDFYKRIKIDKEYKKKVLELKDRILGCFCKSNFRDIPCHGDTFVEYLQNLDKESS